MGTSFLHKDFRINLFLINLDLYIYILIFINCILLEDCNPFLQEGLCIWILISMEGC